MRKSDERSLRSQVEKWLTRGHVPAVRVTTFGRSHSDGRRYVCVETSFSGGTHTLFFFMHDDGSRRVYPPMPVGGSRLELRSKVVFGVRQGFEGGGGLAENVACLE